MNSKLVLIFSFHQVKGPGVGLLGYSKGGDLCLSMASFLKGITATVVINACVANTLAPLCYKDMIIPELSYDLKKHTITGVRAFKFCGYLGQTHWRNQPPKSYSIGKGPGALPVYC